MNDEQPYTVVGGRGTMTVFEIYIKTSPERLWEAITDGEMRKRYSFGVGTESDWTPGSEYRSGVPGVVDIASGENVEVDPPRRLVQTFTALWSEDVRGEGTSRVTWEIEPVGDDSCRLRVTHDQLGDDRQQRTLGRLADDPLRPEDAAGDRRGPDHPGFADVRTGRLSEWSSIVACRALRTSAAAAQRAGRRRRLVGGDPEAPLVLRVERRPGAGGVGIAAGRLGVGRRARRRARRGRRASRPRRGPP